METIQQWLLGLVLLLPLTLASQQIATSLDRGEKAFKERSYQEAFGHYKTASTVSQKEGNQVGLAKSTYGMALSQLHLGKTDSALLLFQQTIPIARQAKEKRILFDALSANAEMLLMRSQYQESIRANLEIVELAGELGEEEIQSSAYAQIGNAYRQMGIVDSAKFYLEKALKLKESRGEEKQLPLVLNGLGNLNLGIGNYEEALQFYIRAVEVQEKNQDSIGMVQVLSNISSIHVQLEQWDQALEYAQLAHNCAKKLNLITYRANIESNIGEILEAQGKIKEALRYYQNALTVYRQNRKQSATAKILLEIGDLLVKQGSFQGAIKHFEEALSISSAIDNQPGLTKAYLSLARLHLTLNQNQKAISYLKPTEGIAEEIQSKPILKACYQLLAQAYQQDNQYLLAYNYLQKHIELSDILFNEENAKSLNELNTKYEMEKKERFIAELTKDQALKAVQLKQQKLISIGLLTGLFFMVGLAFVFYYSIKKNKLISLQKEEINQQKIKELEQQQLLLSMNAMLEGQEVERKRIAKDLHDGLGGLLSTIKLHFNTIDQEIDKLKEIHIYQKASAMLDDACTEVRKIAHNMMPGALTKFGLASAMKDICETVEKSKGIKVDFQVINMEERLPERIEIPVYRIFQELMNNILKHAEAQEIIVQLSQHDNKLHLIIEDDGRGFDDKQAYKKNGLGLQSIASRIQFLKGTFEIDSDPQMGTSIFIGIPLNH